MSNSELAYLHEFDMYLGHQQNSIHGLAYDVVMKLCQHIAGKNHHLYCDNYFTSIPLFTYLLNMKIYASGTIRQNKWGLPGEKKTQLKSTMEITDLSKRKTWLPLSGRTTNPFEF